MLVPPQNVIDRAIVDVSGLRGKVAYPDASLAVRPTRGRPFEPEATARARARKPRLAAAAGRSEAQNQTSKADERGPCILGFAVAPVDRLASPRPRFASSTCSSCSNTGADASYHFNVTEGPSARWTGQQLVNAFPYDSAPKHLIRDRDKIYGAAFVRRVCAMGIEQVLTAPRSPWQNAYCERVIGTLRRECLDHAVVLGEQHLRRILGQYTEYYHRCRTHVALDKDAPEPRESESIEGRKVVALPMVGELHHRYTRIAA